MEVMEELSRDEILELHEELQNSEFKSKLALAAKDREMALADVNWILRFAPLDADKERKYRCLSILLQIALSDDMNENDFLPSLMRIYSEELVEECQSMIRGDVILH